MELLLFKTKEQVIQDGIARLEQSELNIHGSSGKIARLLLNIVNSILADEGGIYEALQINHVRAFLSTATGDALDAIGYMLNCQRIIGESDDNYRYRISQQVLSFEKANETAVRLAALSVDGVRDVITKPFTYGTGSFSIYVVSEQPITPNSILEAVRNSVYSVAGYGIRFEVLSPDIIDVMMNILVSSQARTTETDKNIILANARTKVISYINSRTVGQPLVVSEIENAIRDVSAYITSVNIASMRIGGKLVFTSDQKCRWNQRFLTSSQPDSIVLQAV